MGRRYSAGLALAVALAAGGVAAEAAGPGADPPTGTKHEAVEPGVRTDPDARGRETVGWTASFLAYAALGVWLRTRRAGHGR